MRQRAKQFWSAITAVITKEDIDFLNKFLNTKEIELFNRMDIPTRKHCLNVAKSVFDKAQKQHMDTGLCSKAVKGALFHDIGKSNSNIKTVDKVLYVLMKKYCPTVVNKLRKKPPEIDVFRKLCHKIYSAENHAKFGATLAKKQGLDDSIVNIIYYHHNEDAADPLIKLVREADQLY